MPRKTALSVGDALMEFLKQSHLATGLNTQRVFAAWDEASGAGHYTLKRFYRDGKLYITLSSSVVRSQLSFQKALILEKINSILSTDELFSREGAGSGFVKEIILK